MTKNRKNSFSELLIPWYEKNARDLPWRRTTDPYKIWISEVMLQQTTVNTVIPYFDRWIKTFPTVQDVAHAPLQNILRMWQGLGYYQRAKNLRRSAQLICEQHQGQIPSDPQTLKKLPGFGPYTIGAVLSIAFDQRAPIIDANVRRVVMRLLAIQGHADTAQDTRILAFLDEIMPRRGNNIFNQAMMELGAMVCRPREPLCGMCPVRPQCAAFQKNIQEIIPIPKKNVVKDVDAVVGILKKQEKYFIQKRPSKGLLADLWEFPGGKIESGETPETALRRELREEIGTEINDLQYFMETVHFYTQFRVKLKVFLCHPTKYPASTSARKWVTIKQLQGYPLPSGSAKIVERLALHRRSKKSAASI